MFERTPPRLRRTILHDTRERQWLLVHHARAPVFQLVSAWTLPPRHKGTEKREANVLSCLCAL